MLFSGLTVKIEVVLALVGDDGAEGRSVSVGQGVLAVLHLGRHAAVDVLARRLAARPLAGGLNSPYFGPKSRKNDWS